MLKLDKKCEFIIEQLENSGFEAYAVGGCVRDALMHKVTSDYDITTSALPSETKNVFSDFQVIETGIKHGTVTVIVDKMPFEITTYRKETGYKDNRHPDEVEFVSDINLDLSRRDFTINAIAFSHKRGIVDPFGGINNINNRLIRAVGDPKQRFCEDSLRIIRAIRFSSTLGFEIDRETSDAIKSLGNTLKNVAPERLFVEFKKMFNGDFVKSVIENYKETLDNIFEVNEDISKLNDLPKDTAMRFTYACKDVYKALDYLRADNETKRLVGLLLASKPLYEDEYRIKKWISELGREDARYVLEYRGTLFCEDESRAIEKIIDECNCLSLSELDINGNDLKKLGFVGKQIGEALAVLLDMVLKGEIANKKELLLTKVKDIDF